MHVMLTVAALVSSSALVPFDGKPGLPRSVPQVWASKGTSYANTGSLAVCPAGDGLRLFAVAEDAHRVDLYNATDGSFVRSIGQGGVEIGQFKAPTGIVAVLFPAGGPASWAEAGGGTPPKPRGIGQEADRWAVFVVERENARVQGFFADGGWTAGVFGKGELRGPRGAAVSYTPSGPVVYVSDADAPPREVVRGYRLGLCGSKLIVTLVGVYGDESGPGSVRKAGSVAVDDRNRTLFVADTSREARNVKVYTLEGKFTGRTLGDGLIKGQPGALTMISTSRGDFLLVTDQQPGKTLWYVFDARTQALESTVTGSPSITNTDGVCAYPTAIGQFPAGALFAVNNNADVRAYKLDEVLDVR